MLELSSGGVDTLLSSSVSTSGIVSLTATAAVIVDDALVSSNTGEIDIVVTA